MSRMFDAFAREPLLSASEERDLAQAVEAGDEEARDRLIRANLRLVIWVARRYERSGIPLADLIQEGVFGLMRAVDGYDWRRGTKFSTYATHWIRQRIQRAVAAQSRIIRFPGHVAEREWRINRAETDLATSLGRPPTDEEIAEAAGVTQAELLAVRDAARAVTSLDVAVDETGSDLADLVAVADDDVQAEVEADQRSEEIRRIIATLPERQQEVLVMRYGLDGEPPMTLAEVGRELGLSRERIRQIEQRTLDRLSRRKSLVSLRPSA